MPSVYFESSVFLAIFNGEKSAESVRLLLSELRRSRVQIYTSMVTVQEVSVLSYRRGTVAADNYSKVSKLARIQGMTKDIALTAAKLEAHILDTVKPKERDAQMENNRRRKWDCFHIATAMDLHCQTLYSLDNGMLARKDHLTITSMEFCQPTPKEPGLDLQPGQEPPIR